MESRLKKIPPLVLPQNGRQLGTGPCKQAACRRRHTQNLSAAGFGHTERKKAPADFENARPDAADTPFYHYKTKVHTGSRKVHELGRKMGNIRKSGQKNPPLCRGKGRAAGEKRPSSERRKMLCRKTRPKMNYWAPGPGLQGLPSFQVWITWARPSRD